jgi:putative DNA primase/helicase
VKEVHAHLDRSEEWSSHKAKEVYEYIRADAQFLWEQPPLDRINLSNGLLDLRTRNLLPHSSEFLWPIQIPTNYDPSAGCYLWDWFINNVFPEDSVHLAYEIAGILLIPDRSFQKAFLFSGPGGNGKSAFLKAITSFLGKENVTSLSLQKLETDRFAAARLYGKLANICSDLPTADLLGTSVFKALTGTDRITGEHKYQNSFEFEPFAKLLFSTNRPPRTPDDSQGFWDRWIVIPFEREFRGKEEEISREALDGMLADPGQLSGLLNKALDALPQVRSRGISVTPSTTRALSEFRQTSDPLAAWLDRHTELLPSAVISKRKLIDAYKAECEQMRRPPVSDKAFGTALQKLRPNIGSGQRTLDDKRQDVYLGIELKAAELIG